ncbi:uncharacterized protein [Porites lutea]|uniref:uncharacterized protein n=1 Tax=Porites lutea TaxID=51062 RepID=UPI003CC5A25F
MHFVEMFDAYYGPRYVLMNHRMLLHLKKNVSDHGPLESSSLFVFEDWNGDIGNFHGTQNIANQCSNVERQHAVIEYNEVEGCFVVQDLNSAHGTYINDCRVLNAAVRLCLH